MSTTLDSNRTDTDLRNALLLDFARASIEFSKARLQRQGKDTPVHRVAVAAARVHVDAILDMYLDVRHGVGHPSGAPGASTPRGQSPTVDP